VIVTIEGGAHQQTWQNVGQAIEATKPLLNEDAAVAICCELADPPDPGVQRLIGAHSRDAVMRKVRKERPVDAVAAAQLAGALERGRVYLLSGLDPELVEDLDMVYVSEESEVTRLAQRHGLCIVLPNAALAMVRVDG